VLHRGENLRGVGAALQLKFGGKTNYVFGLLVAVSLAAIVLVPLCVLVLGVLFGREASFGPLEIARLIGATILVPLVIGLAVRHVAPQLSGRIAPWASRLGNVLLLSAIVPVLIKAWPAVVGLIGNATLLAIVTLVGVAIVAGHVVGGPDADERSTLAIASAMRHPGVALAIATSSGSVTSSGVVERGIPFCPSCPNSLEPQQN